MNGFVAAPSNGLALFHLQRSRPPIPDRPFFENMIGLIYIFSGMQYGCNSLGCLDKSKLALRDFLLPKIISAHGAPTGLLPVLADERFDLDPQPQAAAARGHSVPTALTPLESR